jgi:uncharacterized membrane protein YkoI
MGLEEMAAALPQFITILPTIIYMSQLFFYLIFIFFFGSVSIAGYKRQKGFFMGLFGRLLTGVLCLLAAVSFAPFVPVFSQGFLKLLQLDITMAGCTAVVIVYAGLRLISHNGRTLSQKEQLSRLQRKVGFLEELLKRGSRHISEKEAEKAAHNALRGFKAEKSKLVGGEWEVTLKKGDKRATVILDAYDGEVKSKVIEESALSGFVRDPVKAIGAVMILALLAASLALFRGFPDPGESFFDMFGLTYEDMKGISESIQGAPQLLGSGKSGCVSPIIFSRYQQQLQDQEFLRTHLYANDGAKAAMEQNSGGRVMAMIMVDDEGKEVVLGSTDNSKICYLTDGIFCSCIDTG